MKHHIFLSASAIFLAGIFFVINDAIINYLSPLNIKFYHFIFYGSPAYLFLPIYLFFNGKIKSHLFIKNYYIPLLRGLLFAPIPYFTFVSLKHISLPEFTTLNMSTPLFAGLLAIFFLKEKLNLYIFISLIFGFSGVLFVIQPGFANFNYYYLLVILSALIITLTTFIVNKYNNVTTSIGYFIYGGLIIHALSLLLFIYDPISIDLNIFLLITFASISINFAIFLNVYAFKKSQKYYASVFCLVYLQICWTSIIGIIIFGEYLNNLGIIGAFLIVLSGIMSIPGQIKQAK